MFTEYLKNMETRWINIPATRYQDLSPRSKYLSDAREKDDKEWMEAKLEELKEFVEIELKKGASVSQIKKMIGWKAHGKEAVQRYCD